MTFSCLTTIMFLCYFLPMILCYDFMLWFFVFLLLYSLFLFVIFFSAGSSLDGNNLHFGHLSSFFLTFSNLSISQKSLLLCFLFFSMSCCFMLYWFQRLLWFFFFLFESNIIFVVIIVLQDFRVWFWPLVNAVIAHTYVVF